MFAQSSYSSKGELTPVSPLFLIGKGLMLGIFLSIVLLLITTILMFFTPLSEVFVPYIIFCSILLGILSGSYFVGQRVEEKGWLRGGIVGFFYVFCLFLLALVFQVPLPFDFDIITKLFIGFAFGSAGGILGINR